MEHFLTALKLWVLRDRNANIEGERGMLYISPDFFHTQQK
jgi:hypothetical protein